MSLIFAAVFLPLGVNLPYFPLWLEAKGFGPEQIAVVLSAAIFLRVVTTPVISSMADRAKDRANVMAGKVREQASALQGQAQGALGQARDRVMALTGADADQVISMPSMQAAARGDAQGQLGDSPTIAMRDATAANNP